MKIHKISIKISPHHQNIYLLGYTIIFFYVAYIFWPVFAYPWWGADDPMILFKFRKHGLLNMLIVGESWRDLTSFNFNPWLVFSLGADLIAFGLDPTGFYWHQVLSVLVLVVVLEVSLREIDTYGLRFPFIIIFLSLFPVKHTIVQIFTRHYLEGLIFAVLCIYFARMQRLALSALFYFLAVCSKETYALLPLVFWSTMGVSRRSFFSMAIPAVVYVAWRLWMLGIPGGVGGYGCLIPLPDFRDLVELPGMLAGLSGVYEGFFLWGSALVFFVFLKAFGPIMTLPILVALMVPVLPVLKIAQGNLRYLFLLYGFIVFSAFYIFLWYLKKRGPVHGVALWVRGLALVLCAFFVFGGKGLDAERFKRRMLEGRFVWEKRFPPGEEDYLVNYLLTPWHFEALVQLRDHKNGPLFCHDPQFCVNSFEGARFWQWSNGGINLITPVKTQFMPCDTDFEVRYNKVTQTIRWNVDLGHYSRFYLILNMKGVGLAEYELPPRCSIGYVFSPPYPEVAIRLAGAGTMCYSPLISPLEIANEVVWRAKK